MICQIAGHAASGMTGSLMIGGSASSAAGWLGRRHRDDDELAGDGRGDGGRGQVVPGGDPGPRRRRAGADGAGRRHQGVRPHRRGRQVGGVARQAGRRLDVQRRRAGPGDPRAVRRQGQDRPDQQPARVDGDPLPRHPGAELDGRRRSVHAGPGAARPDVHLRVHRQGPGGRHLPLAPRRPDAGAQRVVRGVPDRRDADAAEADRPGLRHRSASTSTWCSTTPARSA